MERKKERKGSMRERKKGCQGAGRARGVLTSSEGSKLTPVFHSLSCHIAWQGKPATGIKIFVPSNHWGQASSCLAFWCHPMTF